VCSSDLHCNGRHPILREGDHDVIYMMTRSPLFALEDFKVHIWEGIAKLCPPGLVQAAYDALHFFLAHEESSTTGAYLLVGQQVTSKTHMRFRDVLLCQPDFAQKTPVTTMP
jgi:hypothetical protein